MNIGKRILSCDILKHQGTLTNSKRWIFTRSSNETLRNNDRDSPVTLSNVEEHWKTVNAGFTCNILKLRGTLTNSKRWIFTRSSNETLGNNDRDSPATLSNVEEHWKTVNAGFTCNIFKLRGTLTNSKRWIFTRNSNERLKTKDRHSAARFSNVEKR
ncbi:hypothetical protein QLX08_008196 [Tetragonisca angustula]|uniref:Uncharacterized protein n=1 Tax=Tetragonisca angustula TaxID=166442 RepID=A0AAW0ZL54_9HYME